MPTIIIRYGASHNDMTVSDNGQETYFDFNEMTVGARRKAGRIISGVLDLQVHQPNKPKKR